MGHPNMPRNSWFTMNDQREIEMRRNAIVNRCIDAVLIALIVAAVAVQWWPS